MTRYAWILAVALLLPAIGCEKRLPKGYVRVDHGWAYDFRAVSADGAAFTVRTEENPENGDLEFWETVIRKKLVDVRGYTLTEDRDITVSGRPARELLFHYQRDGVDYTYILALCVRGRTLYVFEAAGTREDMTADLPELRKVITDWSTL